MLSDSVLCLFPPLHRFYAVHKSGLSGDWSAGNECQPRVQVLSAILDFCTQELTELAPGWEGLSEAGSVLPLQGRQIYWAGW